MILNLVLLYIFSLFSIGFLIYITHKILKIVNIKLNKKDILIISISLIIIFSIYIFIIKIRNYIYTWDNDIYYRAQMNLFNSFKTNFFSGIKDIINTTYRTDYGYFLLVFTTGIFSISDKTPDSFVIIYSIIYLTFIFILFFCITKKILEKLSCNKKYITLIFSMLLLILFPLLHKSAIMGQPDMCGLMFIGWIILLTMDYDFSYKDIKRWILILISTFCLLITRRWYMFFAFGYYFAYLILLLINAIKDKGNRKIILKNIANFAIIAIIILGILIIGPMVYKTIRNNYTSTYSAWSTGGLISEFKSQFYKCGLLYIFIMLFGIIYGIKNKQTRNITIILMLTWIFSIVSFTRIQNMGDHHSLILLPEYYLLFILGVISISNIHKKTIYISSYLAIIFILIINFYGSITENKKIFGNILFTNISIKPEQRTDMNNMKEMVDFIIQNCDINNKAYINSATSDYCRDAFANYYLPNHSDLVDIIPYECAIDSAQGFPNEIFNCKYVFISNIILEDTGATKGTIIPKIKYAIEDDEIISKKYIIVKEFKMTENITFCAYERMESFSEEEKNEWLNIFKEQCELYPNLFKIGVSQD